MNTFKGTPGPWAVKEATFSIISRDRYIADCRPEARTNQMMGYSEAKYNCRAIAALPQLIEALQELMRFDSALRAGAERLQYPDNFLKAIEQAKAAISLALD